jgi:putative hydrolase of the HAD superfamily
MSWREYWSEILAAQGMFGKLEALLVAQKEWNDGRTINREVVSLMGRLKLEGYVVGILSNNRKELRSELEGNGLDGLADVVCVSEELGLMKPDPEIFEIFIRDLGVRPEDLVYIDDSKRSLETAEQVGYTPIIFSGYEQLSGELRELGIIS